MALKFTKLLVKADPQKPGSRGGIGFYDDAGKWRYGDRPSAMHNATPDALQEKLKRLGKGEGREVELTKAELEHVLKTGKFALVSAGPNPQHPPDRELTEKQLDERHKQLGADLKEAGYAYTPVVGHYEGQENTYLVMIHDADRNDVRAMGAKYKQDSVIYGEGGKQEMHFTFGEKDGKYHAGEGYELKPDATDYYTIVPHPDGTHTKFALNFDWNRLTEHTDVQKSVQLILKAETPEQKPKPNAGDDESIVDAPAGFAPRVVKVPMHQGADVNPAIAMKKEKTMSGQAKPKVEKAFSIKPDIEKAEKKGAGSRGGKIAYYTKSGAAVYQSKVKKQAPMFSDMASNWTNNANRSNDHEHHAIAAKQHLVAAFYNHHAGNSNEANYHMVSANVHRDLYEKAGHKSRTTKWNDKNHDSTADLTKEHTGHSSRQSWNDGDLSASPKKLSNPHKPLTSGNHNEPEVKKALAYDMHELGEQLLSKAMTPSNTIGGNMSNQVADLFKSELGESNASAHLTNCVHCKHTLTRDDLVKGCSPQFVADDNDQPHDGGPGQVEPSRASGGSENDVIAPLLKGLKGPDAGDSEEFLISKSEMDTIGMNTEGLEDGWYKITKSEMRKLGATQHLPYLQDRKTSVAKSQAPSVQLQKSETPQAPNGYSPRAGGVHGPGGEQLVQWSEGSDKEIADYISKSGGFGQGTDELVKTQGRDGR